MQVAVAAARLTRTPLQATRLVVSAAAAGAEALTLEVKAPQAEAHLRFTRGSPHKVNLPPEQLARVHNVQATRR